ncbi:MAG: dipeptide/oligopeptide/nickel ABC transporter ATP-binding protein [Chitinispirillales bacterium]|jgi:peptide/nickel transport system ATP-binding protein|nr:dipeptide/oligopeptide/nickel ABC transporter ATP-binding protein [Chitinispirillales bacterium]
MQNDILFEAKNCACKFGHGKKVVKAVDDVTFDIKDGEIVSLVGGSGCGKSVLAKMMLGLHHPTSGAFTYKGEPITDYQVHWREVQAVFQDPFSCFNQFFTIRSQLKSAFGIYKEKPSNFEMEDRVDQALLAVNVKPSEVEGKYPFELSGGQMQRMLLARIFVLRPKVLIADEPTSMVDACVRANILDYLMKLKEELSMTIVFITHDIGLAYYVSDRLFIMHKGKIIEQGAPDDVTQRPKSEHTVQLLEDIPEIHKEWIKR